MTEELPSIRNRELQAIPPTAGGKVEALIPRSFEELKYVAGLLVKSGMVPDSYDNDPQKVAIGIMKGLEVGLPPITALSTIAIINKRPCIWGDGAQALIQQSGVLEKTEVKILGTQPSEKSETHDFPDNFGYEVKLWRKGQAEPYIGTFTVGDAKRAKLWGNVKKQPRIMHPKRMLFARARAFPQRDGFADCLAGLHIREEVEDMPTQHVVPDMSPLIDDFTEKPAVIEQKADDYAEAKAAHDEKATNWKIADDADFAVEFNRLLGECKTPMDVGRLVLDNSERVTSEQSQQAAKVQQGLQQK